MSIARVTLRRFLAPADCGPACDGLTVHAATAAGGGTPVRLAVLGGSVAFAGPGGLAAESTAGRLALRLSHARHRPVRVRNVSARGAGPECLRAQVHQVLAFAPDVAVIVLGDGDLRHRSTGGSVRRLAMAVHRLQLLCAEVALGCPPALQVALAPLFAPDRTLLTSVAEIAIADRIAQPAAV